MTGTSILSRIYMLTFLLQWGRCHQTGQEPICSSRFDYESKMLERMVLVEHRMNIIQESTKTELEKLQKEKMELEEKVVRLNDQLKDDHVKKLEWLDNLVQSTLLNVISRLDDLIQLSKQLTERQETTVADSLRTLEIQANATIKDIYERTIKSAVGFHVLHPSNLSPGPNALLTFTTAVTNTDNVYDTASGYFTAPTSGVYMFAVQICSLQGKLISFRLFVQDDFITDTSGYDGDSSFHCTSTNAVAVLKEGDKVYVKTGPNTYSGKTIISAQDRYSTFTGTLVH